MDNIDNKLAKIKDIVNKDKTLISDIDKFRQISSIIHEKRNALNIKGGLKKNSIQDWQIQSIKDLYTKEKRSMEDICKILGISMSSVRYYLVEGEKEKIAKHNEKQRARMYSTDETREAYKAYHREYQRALARKKREIKLNDNETNENEIEQQHIHQ